MEQQINKNDCVLKTNFQALLKKWTKMLQNFSMLIGPVYQKELPVYKACCFKRRTSKRDFLKKKWSNTVTILVPCWKWPFSEVPYLAQRFWAKSNFIISEMSQKCQVVHLLLALLKLCFLKTYTCIDFRKEERNRNIHDNSHSCQNDYHQ